MHPFPASTEQNLQTAQEKVIGQKEMMKSAIEILECTKMYKKMNLQNVQCWYLLKKKQM